MLRMMRVLLLMIGGLVLSAAAAANPVALVKIEGAIGPATSDYFSRALAEAQDEGATALIVQLDTPGGLDTAMRDIIRDILRAPMPVIAYVAPGGAHAASAGTYILYAAHVAAMAPATNLGAATPVRVGGMPGGGEPPEEPEPGAEERAPAGSTMERKMINDATAYIRSLAELRGRNADWAELAVREAASLSASEALEKNVIEIVASDLEQLLEKLDGRAVKLSAQTVTLQTADAEVLRLEPGWRTQLLSVITNPNVAYILMLIGIYGLIFELANPGGFVAGVLGGISLLLALFAFQALPINYTGLALLLLGLAFMVAEAFVPSFGILGLGGLVSFVIGSVMLLDTESPAFEISLALVGGFAVASLLILFGIAALALRAHGRPVVTGGEQLVGAEGEAMYDFAGKGQVRVHGEIWGAVVDMPVFKGDRVRVLGREGLRLKVERVGAPPAGDPRVHI
jgi:membrane-bound serine protease (ClpP class)